MNTRLQGKSRNGPITLDLTPVYEEELSAAEFLKLSKNTPEIIKSSRAIMPRQGHSGFGSFMVKYLYPRHRVAP